MYQLHSHTKQPIKQIQNIKSNKEPLIKTEQTYDIKKLSKTPINIKYNQLNNKNQSNKKTVKKIIKITPSKPFEQILIQNDITPDFNIQGFSLIQNYSKIDLNSPTFSDIFNFSSQKSPKLNYNEHFFRANKTITTQKQKIQQNEQLNYQLYTTTNEITQKIQKAQQKLFKANKPQELQRLQIIRKTPKKLQVDIKQAQNEQKISPYKVLNNIKLKNHCLSQTPKINRPINHQIKQTIENINPQDHDNKITKRNKIDKTQKERIKQELEDIYNGKFKITIKPKW